MFGGWGEEEYDFYATYVGKGALSWGSSEFRRILDILSFVYILGSLCTYFIRVAPLCVF